MRSDGRFGFGEGKKIRLSFRIQAEAGHHLHETPLSTDQQIQTLPDGSLRLRCTVVDSAMLTWWLRGFGDQVSEISKTPL